ncbi:MULTISPECIES: ATP-dependent DNA ligase [Streptomyces]|uniref:Putative DNA ligase-like protein n=2 Tax=Streptomyces fradiae TaxID=1906 RepID=A0A1Y2NZ09_STRFR|nr:MULTISPECIES: ATP-dependent DNA ligase [Streptomyces]OSY52755.1 putative DNA ligase-like protein [Streptomyces fradiae ATCC 10745 = DSM 40063]
MKGPVVPPVRVALAEAVHALPRDPGRLAYEPKFDGHRMVLFRGAAGEVVLQARSGRLVTAAFPDLAEAARALPDGTVLDGEVVVWSGGRTDFAAVQGRAAATPGRAPALARRLPASYAAFDVLAADGADLRPAPYVRRRERLEALLSGLGPPIQAVPMTTDPDVARDWFETLPAVGVEGLVVKRLDEPYRAGRRAWRKLRHTDTRDAVVIGFTGPRERPSALVLVLPDDDAPVVSGPLAPRLRAEAGAALRGLPEPVGGGTATAVGVGEVAYRSVPPALEAEVAQGTTRHTVTTVLRLKGGGERGG